MLAFRAATRVITAFESQAQATSLGAAGHLRGASKVQDTFRDMLLGLRRYELWSTLGWRDVANRYRRAALGSLWIPLSMAVVAGVLGTLYSHIMQRPPAEYIPYLTAGFIIWNLLSGIIADGTNVFVSNAAAIKEIPAPLTIHIYRVIWKQIIIYIHNVIVFVAVSIYFGNVNLATVPQLIAALVIITLNGLWISCLLGIVNARFRDFAHLVPTAMRLIFFVTPIIWYPQLLGGWRAYAVHLNPFYYFIDILRAPMLGVSTATSTWQVVVVITLLGSVTALPVYAYSRKKIAFWL